ncbi:MAG TPA: hypothetical protein VFY21_04110 [Xanthobacteraceae bacterium]|nr:hypothetical protein [Xanthobacteraceae bacterium]
MNRQRRLLADLWNGRISLSRVFWEYAVCFGTVLNLLTTIASFALVAGDYPGWIAAVVFFLPAPYNLLMIIAVWQSAARYEGRQIWATLARAFIIVWAVAATLI